MNGDGDDQNCLREAKEIPTKDCVEPNLNDQNKVSQEGDAGSNSNDVNNSPKEDASCSKTSSLLSFADDEGLNKTEIVCEACASVILLPKKGILQKEKKFFLPYMKKKPNTSPQDGEMVESFWLIDDMFVFENLGFTNTCTVENNASVKYLICADCEIGPIGIHDIANKKEYFLALGRVKHKN